MSKKDYFAIRDKQRKFKKKSELICRYCNKALILKTATVDHLIPVGRGGPDEEWNYGIACHKCNSEKADMTEDEYREYKINQKLKNNACLERQLERMERAKHDSPYIDVNKFFGR